MTDLERLIETTLLLAPHRQQLLLDTALALLDLQFRADTGSDVS